MLSRYIFFFNFFIVATGTEAQVSIIFYQHSLLKVHDNNISKAAHNFSYTTTQYNIRLRCMYVARKHNVFLQAIPTGFEPIYKKTDPKPTSFLRGGPWAPS